MGRRGAQDIERARADLKRRGYREPPAPDASKRD
jgi:hypothetical protein